MERVRYFSVAILSASVVIFAAQNLHPVGVTFLAWQFETSVTLVTLIPFLTGLVVGGVTVLVATRRRAAREPTPAEPPFAAGPGVEGGDERAHNNS